jgi:CheY-like chemotaxis protein
MADPNQLEMALLNLSVNARDAMPEGGTLRISASTETAHGGNEQGVKAGQYVKLSVADTGTGMDEATMARAVEPFFSTKGVGRGTGLGLSMVHGLALQLGGDLKISSQTGLGTNVELWLPASEKMAIHQEPSKEEKRPALGNGTVLLVDDEDLVRTSTAIMLSDLSFNVVEASCAEEAMRLVQSGLEFDVLVTDHLMPGMNGTTLAHEVRRLRPAVRVLIISGYAETESIAPDLPRLPKPFRVDELQASLGIGRQVAHD